MARPIWTGSINFGLVSIGVELRMAVHEHNIHFHMLSKDGTCRLRRKLFCPETGKEYDFNQTAKGLEIAPGEYVIVDHKEIDRLKPEKGRAMEIVQFFQESALDPVYYDRVYYLAPAKEAKKAYKLLVESMTETGTDALARFVMREKQYLTVLRAREDGLVLHTLHYVDEVAAMDDEVFNAMKHTKVSAGELRMALQLIKSMTEDLHLQNFKDEFRKKLAALIDAKANGKEVTVPAEEEHPRMRTINLMDALKKSLEGNAGAKMNGHRHRRSA